MTTMPKTPPELRAEAVRLTTAWRALEQEAETTLERMRASVAATEVAFEQRIDLASAAESAAWDLYYAAQDAEQAQRGAVLQ